MKPRPDPGDLQWLSQARAGDSSAFGRVTAAYRRPLHTHCYRMLGSPHDADDATGDEADIFLGWGLHSCGLRASGGTGATRL